MVGFGFVGDVLSILNQFLPLFLCNLLSAWWWRRWLWWWWWLWIVVWELGFEVGLGELGVFIKILQLSKRILWWGWASGWDDDVGSLLDDMIVNSAHDDVEAEVLVAVHTGGEEFHVDWHLRLRQILLSNVIMDAFHYNIKPQILVPIHALCKELAGWLVGDADVGLSDMVILTLHNDIESEIFVAIHSRCKEFAWSFDDLRVESLLCNMIVLPLHDNVHAQILISVHTLGEKSLGLLLARVIELGSDLLLDDIILLGAGIQFVVLVFEVGVLVLHSLQLLFIDC